jgi:MFS family permease
LEVFFGVPLLIILADDMLLFLVSRLLPRLLPLLSHPFSGSLVIIVAGFFSGLAPNYPSLLVLRTLCGFGVGGSTVPFDLLAEFLPNSHRGRFLIYIEYFWTIGSIFVAGMAWLFLSQSGWRVLTMVTAIPVAIALIGSIIVLPESPR